MASLNFAIDFFVHSHAFHTLYTTFVLSYVRECKVVAINLSLKKVQVPPCDVVWRRIPVVTMYARTRVMRSYRRGVACYR